MGMNLSILKKPIREENEPVHVPTVENERHPNRCPNKTKVRLLEEIRKISAPVSAEKPLWYVFLLMAIGLASEAWGFVLIKKGLLQHPPAGPFLSGSHLAAVFFQLVSTPLVLLGTALEALHFGVLMELLSFGEVSFIIPLTSVGYVLTPLTALFLLHETIPPERWAGIVLVCAGVFVLLRYKTPS
ncbi:hypothetical protein BOX24_06545 [Leptospirillum ferriphilum]|uniref:EamA domain-containing protein n=3 Tax=Leptospirillum ferriphilum TaxID=178606 RepID=A0A1V3SVY3_9BACT|nr:hypothetical protein LFML04_1650 [Leptospirillum ferriphilum ML-04]OOH72651.1 hypothetical protein BOX24_06545 [Leptospirillum ferriphilum]